METARASAGSPPSTFPEVSGDALEEATLQQRSTWGGEWSEGRKECSRKRQEWVEGPAVGGNSVKYANLENLWAGAQRALVGGRPPGQAGSEPVWAPQRMAEPARGGIPA